MQVRVCAFCQVKRGNVHKSFYCDKSFVPTNRENTLWGVMHCRNTED